MIGADEHSNHRSLSTRRSRASGGSHQLKNGSKCQVDQATWVEQQIMLTEYEDTE